MLRAMLATTLIVMSATPSLSQGLCIDQIEGTKCEPISTDRLSVGLSRGSAIPSTSSMLLNPEYYGLPPVDGHWRYYRIDNTVYRVQPDTMTVIDVVSGGNSVLR